MFHEKSENHGVYFLAGMTVGVGLAVAGYYAYVNKFHLKVKDASLEAVDYVKDMYQFEKTPHPVGPKTNA